MSFFAQPYFPDQNLSPAGLAAGLGESVYSSFSGTDIVAEIVLPGEGALTLGELQTISYSIHRENTPVRIIGHVNALGFVKGPRTIAGSLIFTQFNYYTFYRIRQFQDAFSQNSVFPLADMLPPFDVVLTFANEVGNMAKLRLFGLTIIDEGGTMSIDDLITEQTYTYMARGIQPLVPMSRHQFVDQEFVADAGNVPTSLGDNTLNG
jgi:hypothetical protein